MTTTDRVEKQQQQPHILNKVTSNNQNHLRFQSTQIQIIFQWKKNNKYNAPDKTTAKRQFATKNDTNTIKNNENPTQHKGLKQFLLWGSCIPPLGSPHQNELIQTQLSRAQNRCTEKRLLQLMSWRHKIGPLRASRSMIAPVIATIPLQTSVPPSTHQLSVKNVT